MWLNSETGAVFNVAEAKVTKYAFNVEIPPELFDLPFPPGTYVQDSKQNKVWVALPGGRKRVLTEAERKANLSYDELLKTELGTADVPAADKNGQKPDEPKTGEGQPLPNPAKTSTMADGKPEK